MKRRRRSAAIEPLAFAIQRDKALRVPGFVEASPVAFRDWEAAVGTRIAARARPVRLERGVLVVRTASSTWAQELSLLADDILVQLRARGVAVESLRFRVGHVDAPERPPARDEVRTSPPEVPLPSAVKAEVAKVADPELRDVIAHAAAKNLGWQVAREPRKEPAPRAARDPRPAPPENAPQARTRRTAPGAPRGKP